MGPTRPFLLLLALAWASEGWATDVETQHAANVGFDLSRQFELTLHARFRVQPGDLGRHQIRGGPVLAWRWRPRLALIGGYYYYAQPDPEDQDYTKGHRLFAGVEVEVWSRGRLRYEQSAVAERFEVHELPDFNRYRFRSLLRVQTLLAPYTFHEFFFDARGWRSGRHGAAVRRRLHPSISLDLGYFYEVRRPDVGPHRHVWFSSFSLR